MYVRVHSLVRTCACVTHPQSFWKAFSCLTNFHLKCEHPRGCLIVMTNFVRFGVNNRCKNRVMTMWFGVFSTRFGLVRSFVMSCYPSCWCQHMINESFLKTKVWIRENRRSVNEPSALTTTERGGQLKYWCKGRFAQSNAPPCWTRTAASLPRCMPLGIPVWEEEKLVKNTMEKRKERATQIPWRTSCKCCPSPCGTDVFISRATWEFCPTSRLISVVPEWCGPAFEVYWMEAPQYILSVVSSVWKVEGECAKKAAIKPKIRKGVL